jgi:hypothetical protein
MLIIFNPFTAEHKETQIPSKTKFNGLHGMRICSIFSQYNFCEDVTYMDSAGKWISPPEIAQLLVRS